MDIQRIKQLSMEALQEEFKLLFPALPVPNNQKFLNRKICQKLQEQEYRGLPDETLKRINELITQYDPINRKCFKQRMAQKTSGHDICIPMPGSYITKNYKGKRIEVKVLENGFEYEGEFFKSLTGLATKISGIHYNGFGFFGLKKSKKRSSSIQTFEDDNEA